MWPQNGLENNKSIEPHERQTTNFRRIGSLRPMRSYDISSAASKARDANFGQALTLPA
jgi:hypothetical protein